MKYLYYVFDRDECTQWSYGIFSNEENAKRFVEKHGGEIERINLDDGLGDDQVALYAASISPKGDIRTQQTYAHNSGDIAFNDKSPKQNIESGYITFYFWFHEDTYKNIRERKEVQDDKLIDKLVNDEAIRIVNELTQKIGKLPTTKKEFDEAFPNGRYDTF